MIFNSSSWFPSVGVPNPSAGVQGLVDSANQSQQASRNANASLAQQTLDYWGGVMNQGRADSNRAFSYLQGTNKADKQDINRQFTKLSGDVQSRLIDSGLGNSTIMGSMLTGVAGARAAAMSRNRAEFGSRLYNAYQHGAEFNAGLAGQQLNYLSGIDIGYPDMGAYAQMAAMAGQGSPMGGSGGGGTYIGDMSRPIGGAQPAWAAYGGVGADPGVSGGSWGGLYATSYIPTTSQWAQQQMAQQNQGPGFWANSEAQLQQQAATPGFWANAGNQMQNAWNYNYADVPAG